MRECPHCGRRASAQDRFCAVCATSLPPERREADAFDDAADFSSDFNEADWAPVARFLNAAEAGYFAHELKLVERAPVVITAEESFDAVAGYWTTRFLLCVPAAIARRAAESLQRLVDDDEPDHSASRLADDFESAAETGERTTDVFDPARSVRADLAEPSGVGWVPLVLTLAAGSAALWSVRRPDEPPRPPVAPVKRQDVEQWERLPVPPRPWTGPQERDRGERRFRLEPVEHRAGPEDDSQR
jgi:hypothetical protein